MKIDASMLRQGYRTDYKTGLYAEFSSDGDLTHFGYYVDGLPHGWTLHLEPGQRRGWAEKTERDDYPDNAGIAQVDLPEAVEVDEEQFRAWVERWIEEIHNRADYVLRCSFCQKTQAEVQKLIAGPEAYICNECICLCNEILMEEQSMNEASDR
jgi:hypothetical protein